jgi:Uri superfamily endonuclease
LPPQKERTAAPSKGIYVLVIRLNSDTSINVGALGQKTFKKGTYAYVGSAQKNLEQRVQRHLRREKRKFWHIDYLLGNDATKVIKVLLKQGSKAEECQVANEISSKSEAVNGFGCSDCHCKSHLFRVEDYRFLQVTMKESNHLGNIH